MNKLIRQLTSTKIKKTFEQANLYKNIEKSIDKHTEIQEKLLQCAESLLTDEISEQHKHLANAKKTLKEAAVSLSPIDSPDLTTQDWQNFPFNTQYMPNELVIGYQKLPIDNEVVKIPVTVPFMSGSDTYCYRVKTDDLEWTQAALHNIIMRLSAMLPYGAQFCLLDPAKMGESFPYIKQLPFKRPLTNDIARTLEEVLNDINRIRQNYLDNRTRRLMDVDADIRGNEKFEFVIASNFPKGYDRRSIELLAQIANTGSVTGKYVILQHNQDIDLPNGASMDLFESLKNIRSSENHITAISSLDMFMIGPESICDETINTILDGVAKAKPKETKLEFTDVTDTNPENWWTGDTGHEIRVAIGGTGAKKDDLELWFGESNGRQICAHGMLGAMTGAGKSNLYHAFIMGLACRYSPDELELYLIDGKQGVEFKCYPTLPHAKVVSLNTSPDLSRSVLSELVEEMIRRNELFKREGYENLRDYRKKEKNKLPRILLVVDEYQTLFEDDRDGLGSDLMEKLATQGRSAGIHMLVGSQRFGASGMQNQQSIFGNIHLRMGMQMSEADVTALQEFGPNGKRLLRACKEAGQVVINDSAANDDKNRAGRVTYLSDDLRIDLIKKLADKWQQQENPKYHHQAILLDGSDQPHLSGNLQLKQLFNDYYSQPTPQNLVEFANKPEYEQGLGEKEWYSVEKPANFWLGREMNIHGQANIVMRRRTNEHLLLVGESNEARSGLLSYWLGQLSINHPVGDCQLYLFERAIKGSPWHGIMSRAIDICYSSEVNYRENITEFSHDLANIKVEFERRKSMDEEQMLAQPTIYIVVNEAQRATELQQQSGRYGVKEHGDLGVIISELLEQGAEYGIHIVMSFDNVRAVTKVFDRRDIDLFKHKIVLQMSEDDSFSVIKSRHAALLQQTTRVPIYALYANASQNYPIKFRPYCYSNAEEHTDELNGLRQYIDLWRN
ncbi:MULTISPECIES: FtsK/SpoIIIE domain-containing protein [unclassified Photobacterium]|uniref:FtsK/SpoIIIE domain-containing protein n=1 Tax=unclassified Photobacterium TaxID=2628852 RepID=UPI001EDDB979|nr:MULTISPECIES: FtsK/SpoIIIE domain-containing protein [unclassified Photobacterium]MCG3865648.1 DNA translocase FtsK [Photobacterium sp. Ph6]MCG3877149.1 DNA translocase FtsK [Photobacterium sp. Ph5]